MVEFDVEDLAIIFEPKYDENEKIFFTPIQVVEGYYDEESERFIDKNLYSYPHLTRGEFSKGYALRVPIIKVSTEYPDKSLEEIKKIILEETIDFRYHLGLVEDEYFVIKEEEDNKYTIILDEETQENIMCLFDDNELAEMILKNSIDEYNKKQESNDNSNVELVAEEDKKTKVNPHLLYKQIKETVKGQDNAIKEIVTAIWENYYSDYANNLILIGSSGTGKTEILRQLANKLDIPLLIIGVTGMSQAGYVGTGTDEILKSLLALTKGDVKKAERAIIVLDEIDKIAYNGYESGSISTEGVQNELLKIVEDGSFSVEVYKNGFPSKEIINTRNITFIGVGAFNGMLTSKTEKHLGFLNDISSKEIVKEKIVSEDLIKYGLKPELVGRMGKIIKLNDLDLSIMKDIVKNSKKSAYVSKIKFITQRGIKIDSELEEEIIDEIAKIAISKKIGARSISGIVNEMFSDILFDISDPDEKYIELQISKETVTNPKKYMLRK